MTPPPCKPRKSRKSRHGEFSGEPRTTWMTESGADRCMSLLEMFGFRDPDGKDWTVLAGYAVDGASIPRALWTLVGSPYTGDYRRASIVHDKACDDAGGDAAARLAADRMFYHACRAGGCSVKEATLLYIGVRIGALMPDVAAWRGAESVERTGARLQTSAAEQRVEADFRLIADLVLSQAATDDPRVIERRTDGAVATIAGIREARRRRRTSRA